MELPTLPSSDERRPEATVNRLSSIDQYNSQLLVEYIGGVAHPISFDFIDYIGPDCLKTHLVTFNDGDDIGYRFPVGKCTMLEDTYLWFDKDGLVMKALPEWTGMAGFYKEYETGPAMYNLDGSSLGQRNRSQLDIGMDYVLAQTTLEADR